MTSNAGIPCLMSYLFKNCLHLMTKMYFSDLQTSLSFSSVLQILFFNSLDRASMSFLVQNTLFMQQGVFADFTVQYGAVILCYVVHYSSACNSYTNESKAIKLVSFDHFFALNLVMQQCIEFLTQRSFNDLVTGAKLSC